MNPKVILTCAVTGGDDVASIYPNLPVTPRQIADAAIEAGHAGAAIAHVHVRDPSSGKPSMDLEYYRQVVNRIRDSKSDIIINLTTGPGARFVPSNTVANQAEIGSNLRLPEERVRHIAELRPEICSLDMGSLNFGRGALINVPAHIEVIAAELKSVGVKPELEVFDTGHIALAKNMIERGLIDASPLFQMVLGVPWGAPATPETMAAMKSLLPAGATWAAFGVSRWEFPMVAQSILLGGHARVGMEDNLFVSKGVKASSNAQLVDKAVSIIRLLGADIASPAEARALLGLRSTFESPIETHIGA